MNFATPSLSFGSTLQPFTSQPGLTLTIPTTSSPSTTTMVNHGLGGSVSQTHGNDSSVNTQKSAKESSPLPPEIVPLVEALKKFVKDQKLIREENSQQRFSIQPIVEVGTDLEDNLKVNLHKIDLDIQRNDKAIEVLKKDTNKLLSNAEMAHRIARIDVPSSGSSYTMAQNQYINLCIHQYFVDIIASIESQMNIYANRIKELQIHLDNMNKPYAADELFQIMRKEHETLVSLAAMVYAIHDEINNLKTQNAKAAQKTHHTLSGDAVPANPTLNYLGPNPFLSEPMMPNMTPQTPQPQTSVFQNQSLFGGSLFQSSAPTTTASSASFNSSFGSSPNISQPRVKRWTTS